MRCACKALPQAGVKNRGSGASDKSRLQRRKQEKCDCKCLQERPSDDEAREKNREKAEISQNDQCAGPQVQPRGDAGENDRRERYDESVRIETFGPKCLYSQSEFQFRAP